MSLTIRGSKLVVPLVNIRGVLQLENRTRSFWIGFIWNNGIVLIFILFVKHHYQNHYRIAVWHWIKSKQYPCLHPYRHAVPHCSVSACGPHTCVLRPGLGRGRAWLSEANGIASHHPELVLHPCIQPHHCGCEHVPGDRLRHWNVEGFLGTFVFTYWRIRKRLAVARVAGSNTCVHGLPAHRERCPSLDAVTGNRAAVVPAWSPTQLRSAVCDFFHCNLVWGAWGGWNNKSKNRRCKNPVHETF